MPRTETGRSLFVERELMEQADPSESMLLYASTVDAIEQEAVRMERERIRAGLLNAGYFWHQPPGIPDKDGFRTYSCKQVDRLVDEEAPA